MIVDVREALMGDRSVNDTKGDEVACGSTEDETAEDMTYDNGTDDMTGDNEIDDTSEMADGIATGNNEDYDRTTGEAYDTTW